MSKCEHWFIFPVIRPTVNSVFLLKCIFVTVAATGRSRLLWRSSWLSTMRPRGWPGPYRLMQVMCTSLCLLVMSSQFHQIHHVTTCSVVHAALTAQGLFEQHSPYCKAPRQHCGSRFVDAGVALVGLDGTLYDQVLDFIFYLGLAPPRFSVSPPCTPIFHLRICTGVKNPISLGLMRHTRSALVSCELHPHTWRGFHSTVCGKLDAG